MNEGIKKNLAPIVLFTYNRLAHTQSTIGALKKNELSKESDLIVYIDAPKNIEDTRKVDDVKRFVKTLDGFKKIKIIERKKNMGLSASIIDGVTAVVDTYGKVIVLEDDLHVGKYFLQFMNESLDMYEQEQEVISVHGYLFPLVGSVPETFFLKGAECWGWATWKRGWDCFNPNARELMKGIKKRHAVREFDYHGSYPCFRLLKEVVEGKVDSWAIRWQASAFLLGKLTLHPGKSLVRNTGFDNSGVHGYKTTMYDVELCNDPISIKKIEIVDNQEVWKQIALYFESKKTKFGRRLINFIKRKLKV